jgi:hypothetical protein
MFPGGFRDRSGSGLIAFAIAVAILRGSTFAWLGLLSVAQAAERPTERPTRPESPRPPAALVEFVEKLRRGDTNGAFARLNALPEDHPDFLRTMTDASEALAEAGRGPQALHYVRRAYQKAPDDIAVAHSFIRVQLLVRTNLSQPVTLRPLLASNAIPEAFKFILESPAVPDASRDISRRRLMADLEFLEVILANAYSYAERRGVDWRKALDVVRASLDDRTPLDTFATRLRRFLTLFGDPHTGLRTPPQRHNDGGVPFLAIADGPRVLALKPDRSAFIDPRCRVITAIDGRPLDEWLRLARREIPRASPQWERRETVAALERLSQWRRELGLPPTNEVQLSLASADGTEKQNVTLAWLAKPVRVRWPTNRTGRIEGNLGYLRIPSMNPEPAFLQALNESMEQFRSTRGLIIDVRGNGGGSQDALRTLLPYFLATNDPMRIVNVAAYRLPVKLPQPCAEGYLGLANRGLYPATSRVWSPEQRQQIESFLTTFKPSWALAPGKFSDWHVMGIAAATNPEAYPYTNQVVVLMDAGSFSATDNFLGAFQGLPKVTLIGTTSGGGSGRMTVFRLPHSRLPFTVCQMASFRANGDIFDGRGVAPDVVMEPAPEDHLITGSDSVLSAAVLRLRSKPQN